jgi:predicted transglutaminase-like protease
MPRCYSLFKRRSMKLIWKSSLFLLKTLILLILFETSIVVGTIIILGRLLVTRGGAV